ncbi:unnamed protein product [Spirodela intermedia]|nr:unnamed protein product [Spirodela intermedia]CAA6666990.1 unnamed protein product [Spirodela intermedia]
MDRQFSVSRRFESAARTTLERVRELDYELGIGRRWRTLSMDFSRNWPRYSKELKSFADTPLGRAFVTIFFLWFALSGGLFNFLALATLLIPVSSFILGNIANKLVIQGTCPACRTQFVGNRNQVVQCRGCGNIVWQPKQDFSRGKGNTKRSSNSEPDIIDIEIEEK